MRTAWTQRVGAFAALPALIQHLGTDPVALMIGAGLAPDSLDLAENRIPYSAFGRLFRAAAERTDCGHFGLLAGRLWHLADLGLLGDLMRNSATVGEALRTLVVYQHVDSEGGVPFVLERAGIVDVGYAIYFPGAEGTDQIYEAYLAAGFNFLRELCGGDWRPTEVFVAHAKPNDCRPYGLFFKVQPRFNADFCALRFPAHWMKRRVEGANPARLQAAQQQARAKGSAEFVQRVFRVLRILLLYGKSSGDDVAHMLSMHRRTLNRRLRAEGTTYQEILDQVRYEAARQLLAGSDVSLDDVAAVLGYAGVTQFTRTFRRWAGVSPGRWRHAARHDSSMVRPVIAGSADVSVQRAS
jgi:AraC-like DNA-binding protein